MLLAEHASALDRRFKKVEANQARMLDSKLHALRKELQQSLDSKLDVRLTAAEQRLKIMVTRLRRLPRRRRQQKKVLRQLVVMEEVEVPTTATSTRGAPRDGYH